MIVIGLGVAFAFTAMWLSSVLGIGAAFVAALFFVVTIFAAVITWADQ